MYMTRTLFAALALVCFFGCALDTETAIAPETTESSRSPYAEADPSSVPALLTRGVEDYVRIFDGYNLTSYGYSLGSNPRTVLDLRAYTYPDGISINDRISSIWSPAKTSRGKWYITVTTNINFGGKHFTLGVKDTGFTQNFSGNLSDFNNSISSIEISLQKDYASTRYQNRYPSDRENRYSEEAQGIASDSEYWYISDKWHVSRIHMSKSLSSPPAKSDCKVANLNCGADHIGDIDAYGGYLYVPYDGCSAYGGVTSGAMIGIFDANKSPGGSNLLYYFRYGFLGSQKKCGWVAFNPQTGLLYTGESSNEIKVYNPRFSTDSAGKAVIYPLYTISLDQKPVPYIQGGCFGDDGLFYLSSAGSKLTDPDDEEGIYVYHLYGRFAEYVGFIKPNMSYLGSKETEGIDYYDTRNFGAEMPGFVLSNLHMMILDNDNVGSSGLNQDDVSVEHYWVTCK